MMRDRQKGVQKCLNGLEQDFREVIVLRDIQGFAYTEIADMLSLAEGTVKSRLFRARDAVKSCLKKLSGDW
ncbi:MAG: RNA polymerase subunit sigma-24, partial [Nitrospirae bacterium]|nr:RNA polymerase subunit sigma-24 [Nitrospirota bacterium]